MLNKEDESMSKDTYFFIYIDIYIYTYFTHRGKRLSIT